MSQTVFQFKKFAVHQDRTAMKVCTDSCIFGAIAQFPEAKNILDIGTGTGLLSLMLAQRHPQAQITALEIDPAAYQQATENISVSIYSNQITTILADITQYTPPILFDGIICNPPFFQNNLKSPYATKNQAHHNDTLTLSALATSIHRLLNKSTGTAWILLPEHEQTLLKSHLAQFNLYPTQTILVYNTQGGKIFRDITQYSFSPLSAVTSSLIIKSTDNQYTPEFVELLRDYYLKL